MNGLLINILLALAWVSLRGELDAVNFFFGFGLGYLILWFAERTTNFRYASKARIVVSFVGFFLWELLLSNLRVAYEVITPPHTMKPAVVRVPLDLKSDAEITLLANLITLTPGTLSLNVSDDKRNLYVHTMYLDDVEAFREKIKTGFERRVQEVFAP